VKIGGSASETLALLTVAYGEYIVKKWSVLDGTGGSRKGEGLCKTTQKWATKNAKDRCKCGQSTNLGALRSKIRCASNSRGTE
jgi:hypothetical protein